MFDGLNPYPRYKDSGVPWLGDVPKHWEVLPGRSCYREKKVPNVGLQEKTVLSLSYGQIVVKSGDKLHGLVPESFENYQIVEPGDIIVRPTDLQNDQTSLRFGVCREKGIITSAYLCFEIQNRLNSQFGFLLLNAYDLKKVFYGLGSGLRQNLDWQDFKSLPCLVPPGSEQSSIVRFLDYADRRIRRYVRSKQKLIKLLEEQKQAVVHRVLTQGLDSNQRRKTTGNQWFSEIPEHCEILTMRRLIRSAIDGPHFSPNYLDDGIPFLSARNITRDGWSLGDVKHISEDDYTEFCKRVVPERGDILYTKGGTTGIARVVDLDFRFQVWVHVAVLKVIKSKVFPEFLAMALNSPRCYEQSQLFTRGATNQDLGLNRMKEIALPVPPIRNQIEILKHIPKATAQLTQAVDRSRNEIDLLRQFRTCLIANVITGKLDVRAVSKALTDVGEESHHFDKTDALGAKDDESTLGDGENLPKEDQA